VSRRRRVVIGVVVAAMLFAFGLTASARVNQELTEVRSATAVFHTPAHAEAANYERFLDCFDSPDGGMGQHYVNLDLLDAEVSATQPEAMVYEVGRNGHLNLVAVEWIVPGTEVDPLNPPMLFDQMFHLNESLGVWVLHAWIWRTNPSGLFSDWNPNVAPCP
jgi:hypothetical protein